MSEASHGIAGGEGFAARVGYCLMAFQFRVRDALVPRAKVLAEVDIEPGDTVLDFGCGPGGYVEAVCRRVGLDGRIVAVDRNPRALRSVERLAERRGLRNVQIVQTEGPIGLPDESVDVCLLYDTFHHLEDPAGVLAELHRVLKDGGLLSFSDHHLDPHEAVRDIVRMGGFAHVSAGERTITFTRV